MLQIRFNFLRFGTVLFWTFVLNYLNRAKSQCLENIRFDYIVVGSGSSGATIANRLSETSDVRVLLVEAGVEPTFVSTVPLITYQALHSVMDWNFTSVPQFACCHIFNDAKMPIFRGKALGGTSSLNFMTNTRGFQEDYDNWSSQGNEGWDWKSVLPYILKQEDYQAPIPNIEDVPYHHNGGPMTVEIPTFKSPMAAAFLEAAGELGYPNNIDYNGAPNHRIGFMYPPVNTRGHARCSTYVAYIIPALERSNFVLEKGSFVTKIIINSRKVATGIKYLKNGTLCTATADREVIVSAGTIGSPKLLMLSGIGSAPDLSSKGVKVIHHLPGVGQNYQDHVAIGGIQFLLGNDVTYKGARYETPEYLEEWKINKTGPMQCPDSFEGVAFLTTTNANSTTWPDIEMFFNSGNVGRILRPFIREIFKTFIGNDEQDVVSILPILLRPRSRGSITLASNDPLAHPLIDPRLLTDLHDIDTLRQAIQIANKVINTHAFKKYGAFPMTLDMGTSCKPELPDNPIFDFLSDFNWLTCAIPILSTSAFHPAGTCKMAPSSDPGAVVDNELRVYGIKNLRVADASIMPNVVASHTNIPCVTIGEKTADMIKRYWNDPTDPLPPLPPL